MSISARFKRQQGDFCMDVDVSFPASGITALFGASGAGKTTLLRAIAGLEKIVGGYLQVGDQVWQKEHQLVPTHQRRLGYVFQEASLFNHLSVEGNLNYAAKRVAGDTNIGQPRAIELLGLQDLLNRQPETLSGGERQRVAIARALAANPQLLLMDEPLVALDQARKQELMPYLEALHQDLDIPIIYVSHAIDEVARLADHLVLLEAGKVSASGPIADMLTRLDLSLAKGEFAETLIEATVTEHDEQFNLSYLDFDGGRFTVVQKSLSIGEKVRLRIAAKDVSITLKPPSDTSILNTFAATIDDMTSDGDAQMVIRLKVADAPLLARITRKSVSQLTLKRGQPVYAQIKSVAVLS